ncbi:RHS repeat-associated core domain-containing protein [Pseudomonas sp. BMS12]|uniref:RHS repeat-associated core domain-containing protein n=1 Tax=Pseudomonas sp. BMS12 TaxID=1796033 RepID=UPI000839F3CC|nr:RHS repeat-associated core domain-containing protein [Pseudomonas sp. BMS12]
MLKGIWGRVGLWLCGGVIATGTGLAYAKPGLDHRFSTPHYAKGELRLDVLDLQVQALGGPVRILRSWKGGQWVWNERWSDLDVLGAADPAVGAADPANADKPYAIVRAGQSYLRASSTTQGQDVYFNNLPQRTLIALQHGLAGYRWQDTQGNRNDYDAQGRMTGYQDHNGIRTTLVRNAEGRIAEIKDHHGATLITLTYTGANLTSAKDYSGREVKYEYSGSRLSAVTDVLGKRWQYHYDTNGLAGYTDPLQQRTTLVLGKDDKVQEHRLPDGRFTQYSYRYDESQEQYYLRTLNEAGLVTERWYDRLGQLVRKQLDGETQFSRSYLLSDRSSDMSKVAEAYRISGKSLSVSKEISQRQGRAPSPYVAQMTEEDAHGNRTLTEYNRYGQTIRVQYADGSEIRKSYDPATNRVSEEINERGIKTQYRYDGKGNLIELIEAAGLSEETRTTYRYDALGQLEQEDRPGDEAAQTPAASWQYGYDGKGNRNLTRDPLGYETRYTHDVQGSVLTVTNALSKTWTSTYDAAGNLKSLKTPLNQETLFGYNDLGQRVSVQAPNGAITTIEPNAAGMPKSITDAANARTQFEYDASQRLVAVVDAYGNRSERHYDKRGRLSAAKDALGATVQYRYEQDRLAGIDYPTYQEDYEYDSRERRLSEVRRFQANGENTSQKDQFGYLANGLSSQWTDAAENATRPGYDSLGRLISSVDAENGVTRFAYDARGNLIQVTDPAGRMTRFRYDARDAVVAEIKVGDGDTPTTERRYAYDDLGNLKQVTTPDSRVSTYHYDDGNRLQRIEHFASGAAAEGGAADSIVEYGYSLLSRLASYEDETSKAVYTHDALGRVESITTTYKQADPVFSKTIRYTYDLNGRRASYTTPEQQTYGYRYTPHGRLAGVSIPGEGSISFQDFNWLMPQSILFPGGNQYSLNYDGLQRYAGRVLKDAAGNPIQSWQYGYDAVGNITAIDSQAGKTSYGYDKLYRLTEAKYPESDGRQNEAYAYDGVGNRLDEATSKDELDITQWQYNAHNQLVSHDGIGYRNNRDGHLIERGALQVDGSLIQSGAIDHWLYQYDARERLVAVQKNGQLLARYTYNPLGQRISKALPQLGATTYYLYSEEGLVGEYDAKGELLQEYAYNPTAPWMSQPLFTRAKSANAQGQSLQVHYYGTSHLGAPEVAFLKSGEVTWQAKAKAFGETTVTLNTLHNPLRFPGQYFDQETGLHYNYFRDYDPVLGRYIESDPIGMVAGKNYYTYSSARPLNAVDVYGLFEGELCPLTDSDYYAAGPYSPVPGEYYTEDGELLRVSIDPSGALVSEDYTRVCEFDYETGLLVNCRQSGAATSECPECYVVGGGRVVVDGGYRLIAYFAMRAAPTYRNFAAGSSARNAWKVLTGGKFFRLRGKPPQYYWQKAGGDYYKAVGSLGRSNSVRNKQMMPLLPLGAVGDAADAR